MTAHELIDSIFRRAQAGMPGNQRVITPAQLGYLRDLIGQDSEGGAVVRQGAFRMIWMPRGRQKYVLAEDPHGRRHTIEVLADLKPSGEGRLF